jgi:hypothetical protein
MKQSAMRSMPQARIVLLEEALADYAVRYGLTDRARHALGMSEDSAAVCGQPSKVDATLQNSVVATNGGHKR